MEFKLNLIFQHFYELAQIELLSPYEPIDQVHGSAG